MIDLVEGGSRLTIDERKAMAPPSSSSAGRVQTLMASTLPAPLLKVLQRGGGGVGHGIVGLLLCILSSAPLANLSKKAASLIAVLITALFALVQRLLRDRRGALAATSDHKQLVLEDANGLRHEVIFLGDRGVGKSSLLSALRSHVPASLKEVGDGGLLSGLGSSLAKGESPSLCHARASSTGASPRAPALF